MPELGEPAAAPERPSAFRGARIFPDLPEDLLLNLFHKGIKVQWTSRDLDWESPVAMSESKRIALAHLLTPVYFGEQTAMAGAGSIMPQLLLAGETTAALYVSTFITDEARHFEALTRLYRQLGVAPTSLRRMPELLRYYHRIGQGDRADWVWGIAFSDVIAKHFYRAFGLAQADPLFGEMSKQILVDESRHLTFADHYLLRNVPLMDAARRRAMVDMRDDLFRLLSGMTERVRGDAAEFDVDSDEYLAGVWVDIEKFASRIGLPVDEENPPGGGDLDGPNAGGGRLGGDAMPSRPPARPARTISLASAVDDIPRCFGCLLAALCGRRLAPV